MFRSFVAYVATAFEYSTQSNFEHSKEHFLDFFEYLKGSNSFIDSEGMVFRYISKKKNHEVRRIITMGTKCVIIIVINCLIIIVINNVINLKIVLLILSTSCIS